MAQGKRQFRTLEFFLLLTCVLLLVLYYGYLDHAFPDRGTGARLMIWTGMPLLAGGFFLFLHRLCPLRLISALRSFLSAPGCGRFILLFLLFAIPRAVYRLCCDPPVISDYKIYVTLGEQYAADGTIGMINYVTKIAPNITIYVAVLGLLMRVFGPGAATAQIFVMILNGCNVFLLYAAARRLTSRARAYLAAALFTLIPENIFYSVLPGIEAISLFTILLGLLMILSIPGKKAPAGLGLALAGGALLALSAFIRASAWAAAAGAAVWLLTRRGLPVRRLLALFAAIAVGIGGSWLCYRAFQRRVFPEEMPVSGIGWPLFEGLDITGGGWSEEKAARKDEIIESHSAKESDRILMKEALERFNSYSFTEKLRMFGRKGGIVWFDSGYSVYMLEDPALRTGTSAVAGTGLYICIALWIACMAGRVRRPLRGTDRAACALCLTVILLTTLWHEFGTSISRYRYMMLPFATLMTGVILPVKTRPWEPALKGRKKGR